MLSARVNHQRTQQWDIKSRTWIPLASIVLGDRTTMEKEAMLQAQQLIERVAGASDVFLDGSSFSMPDTPELQFSFGQPGCQRPGCGFPVAKILALFHAGTGMLLDVLAAPWRTRDMSQIDAVHPLLERDDVLVGDRGFCSFVHLAMLVASLR